MRVFVSAVLWRQATLGVAVLTRGGQVRKILYQGHRGRGKHVWSWDGRRTAGVLVPGGTYVIRMRATNARHRHAQGHHPGRARLGANKPARGAG